LISPGSSTRIGYQQQRVVVESDVELIRATRGGHR
jgi:hypothetical protein